VGDFMIARRNGAPAYQVAVVVDDAHQGVTEVLRGVDLLPSAARQQQLQRGLGFATPTWVHVPLVVDETGRRLAKRYDDLSLSELRERGVDPRAVVAWAANSAGFDVPNRVAADEVLSRFELGRVPRQPVRVAPHDVESLIRHT
jgi:glutamyl-tRNA synthetase